MRDKTAGWWAFTSPNPSNKTKSVAFGAVLLLSLQWFHWSYLSGKLRYYHDGIASQIDFHLFYGNLLSGLQPFWSPYMNSGEPIWTHFELVPYFDPIPLLIYPLFKLFGLPSALAFQHSCFWWLLAFSIGGMILSRKLTGNWWIQLSVFTLLFVGPVAAALPAQPYGLLVPFRYVPFALLALDAFAARPSNSKAWICSATLGLALSTYQSAYAFVFILLWGIFCFAEIYPKLNLRTCVSYLGIMGIVPTLILIPTIVAYWQWTKLVLVARMGLAVPWSLRADSLNPLSPRGFLDCSHGCGYMGVIPTLIVLSWIVGTLITLWRKPNILETKWLLLLLLSLLLGLGGLTTLLDSGKDAFFLGLRNWGMVITVFYLCMTQIFALSYSRLSIFSPRATKLAFFVFLGVFATMLNFIGSKRFYLRTDMTREELNWFSRPAFFDHREWMLDPNILVAGKNPFVIESATLLQRPVTHTPVLTASLGQCEEPKCGRLTHSSLISHQFRLKRFNDLVTSIDSDKLMAILGVTQPVIRTVSKVEWAENASDSLEKIKAIRDPRFFADHAVIEQATAGDRAEFSNNDSQPTSSSHIDIHSYDGNRLALSVEISAPASYLIFSDNWADGWKVRVSGSLNRLAIANHTLKAVLLKRGRHLVEFFYEPTLYAASSAIRLVVVIFASIFLIVILSRRFWCVKTSLGLPQRWDT